MIDASKENVLRIIHWLEAHNPILRRGDKPLPEIKLFDNPIPLMLASEGYGAVFRIGEGKTSGGAYDMLKNKLYLYVDTFESVLVHELAHFLQPVGMTHYESESLAYEAQLAWLKERGMTVEYDFMARNRVMQLADCVDTEGFTFDFRNPPPAILEYEAECERENKRLREKAIRDLGPAFVAGLEAAIERSVVEA